MEDLTELRAVVATFVATTREALDIVSSAFARVCDLDAGSLEVGEDLLLELRDLRYELEMGLSCAPGADGGDPLSDHVSHWRASNQKLRDQILPALVVGLAHLDELATAPSALAPFTYAANRLDGWMK